MALAIGGCEETYMPDRDADCKQACIDQGPDHSVITTVSGWGWSADQDLCKCLTEHDNTYLLNKALRRPKPPCNEYSKKLRDMGRD